MRFQPLVAREGVENWKNILAGLLDDPQFTSNPELVEALAADVLWDSAAPLTDAHRKLKRALAAFEEMWGKRTIHCDLQVAALLLDMDSVLVAFDGPPPDATAMNRDRQIAEQIRQLRFKIDGDHVYLGLSPALPNLLNLSPEDYGHLQSLVLELVIPVNPDFLEESNFKKFLDRADLLDFPGVGNDSNAKFTRIDLGFGNAPTVNDVPVDIPLENRFPKYNPRHLFTRILKRGKTATIVSLYARKLKIDGFSLFLALDKNPPAKPSELNEGINTWWKCAVPSYYKGGRNTKSPLPLNLVLLWWANLINEAGPAAANFMARVKWIYDPLGDISNPAVSNFFTLNYYRIAHRGGVLDQSKLKRDSFFVRGILAEPEFKRVFGVPESTGYRSFMRMIEDAETGGAEFYFNELCLQLEKPVLRRDQILKGVAEVSKEKIISLLAAKDLFPEPEERDVRREILEAMEAEILALIDVSDDRTITQINHLLRETLNIDFRALKPVPMFPHEVNTDFLRSQFASWITSQCNRVEAWRKNGRRDKPDWSLLGLDSREKLRSWLEALVASLEGHLLPMAVWLKDLVEYNLDRPGTDLRRILAIRMGNVLIYGKSGPPSYDSGIGDSASFDDISVDPKGRTLKGRGCPAYKVFLQPFLEAQLKKLLNEGIGLIQRQAQPGDEQLRKLCMDNDCLPACAQSPDESKK
jgi:PAS domain-containing protein